MLCGSAWRPLSQINGMMIVGGVSISSTSPVHWNNGHEGNSSENGSCRKFGRINSPQAGVPMTSWFEFSSRAALCRQLARQEPFNRALWMAEAENWSRLSKKIPREPRARTTWHFLAILRRRPARSSSTSDSKRRVETEAEPGMRDLPSATCSDRPLARQQTAN